MSNVSPLSSEFPGWPAKEAPERTPQGCPYHMEPQQESAYCRSVQLLSESDSLALCRVSVDVCRACCQLPEPRHNQPNAVVASLAHAIVCDYWESASDPHAALRASERMVWIEHFLDAPATPESGASDHLLSPPVPPATDLRDRTWPRLFSRSPRIGLVGTNNLKGLGHQNRDLVRQLKIQDWLLTDGGDDERMAATGLTRHVHKAGSLREFAQVIPRFLDSIEVLLFIETPGVEGLTRKAQKRGIPVVCIPNWEWLHPGLKWLQDVDLMFCPTNYTRSLMSDWRQRFGFEWRVESCPWPIAAAAFPFQARAKCCRFVYINGTDRRYPCDRAGRPTPVRRKGLETLLAAARLLPHIPFLVWSQVDDLPPLPPNVELRLAATDNWKLYTEGDVCVQLSRWEGLGLPLLECQAAGMPLITTDAPPMNEHNPLAVIPVSTQELLELWPRRWIAAPQLKVEDVVRVLTNWHGCDILQASRNARTFVEQTHSWDTFHLALRAQIRELTEQQRRRE